MTCLLNAAELAWWSCRGVKAPPATTINRVFPVLFSEYIRVHTES